MACYGNEIDDLFVSETHLRRGYGRELLLWAMDCIRSRGYDEIVLHVAAWNEGAVRMYRREGFVITKSEIILKEQDDMCPKYMKVFQAHFQIPDKVTEHEQ